MIIETALKNKILLRLSEILCEQENALIEANQLDAEAYPEMDDALKDRLKVDGKKIDAMSQSLIEVAGLEDPEGKILYEYTRPDGLKIENRSVPFGTILIIYESRPDVTIEAAATAFKAGNRILLKGGKESAHTNSFLTKLWQRALSENGVDASFVEYLNLSREETQRLIRSNSRKVDLIIPRGGDNLIRFVKENTSIPLIISGRGNNFLYVDDECDFDTAVRIVLNGKSRLSVCNALDKVLINENMPDIELKMKQLMAALARKDISSFGDKSAVALDSRITEDDGEDILFEEFLSAKIFFSLVPGVQEAVEKINAYSGGHSATIVTCNPQKAVFFMQEVDCAAVYHNASTRFTDGGQFGVGAEIAISTQKLHFRGPIGAAQLVTNKWFVFGEGQIRE
ncbi:MAG: glutamate-5-semialdehyde dehydrogenase [Dysgonamonadaceae bacterium]|jgi:glutamate-5-semialdehyde dehydrogenase|nr:glutamate-5-semialdehyde dehydrogenase [Dysgonamonadaceae bacterium]